VWRDAGCGQVPSVGRCHVWKHNTHIMSDVLSRQWTNECSLIERGCVRFGSRKYLLLIFRSQNNYTTNRFSELNTSALIHCIHDGEGQLQASGTEAGAHWIGEWVGSRADLDHLEKKSFALPGFEPRIIQGDCAVSTCTELSRLSKLIQYGKQEVLWRKNCGLF